MWLIYALGGGWGHLTRACALARIHPARILTNSPHAGAMRSGLDIVEVTTREDVIRELYAAAPNVFIVDTFPRGLGGELAEVLQSVEAFKVLVHRDLNPRYVESVGLREFVESNFDLVVVPGEGEGSALGDLPIARMTAPWLVRSSAELTRSEPRHVYICAAGKAEEAQWYAAVAAKLRASGVVVRDDRYWPAIELFASAAAVVGGGGYNTVHECLALHVPLVARAWPRKYDRQALRLERACQSGEVRIVESVNDAVSSALEYWSRSAPNAVVDFTNGAHEAAQAIEDCSGISDAVIS
jgi:hypothetical protein